jgi:FtsZ-binding cell division protein ZapB
MKNFKLELFNFNKTLTIDQTDIAAIVEHHIVACDKYSEKEIYSSLNEKLGKFTYDNDVKFLLEGLNSEIQQNTLTSDLKDLYRKVERKNHAHLYRQPLNAILNIISKNSDEEKMESIVNELVIYDWIPEVKMFMMEIKKNPIEIQNYRNSGKSEKVFTLVEKINEGILAYVVDRWFLFQESEVKQVIPDDYIKEEKEIRRIRLLEEAMKRAEISDKLISFRIDENLKIALSTKDGSIYLNEVKAEAESNLENVFNSPIIPYLKKDYYVILKTVSENLDKFVDLDVSIKISNLTKPFLEAIAFNYKDKMYLYSIDKRTGSRFYQYESVNTMINDIHKELDFDITSFFENKLSKELKHLKTLEDREQKIENKIKETNEAIDMLKSEGELLKNDKNLKIAFDNLLIVKHNLIKESQKIKNDKKTARKQQSL